MQKVLYEDGVVVIFGYPDMLEAYRTDVVEEGSPQLQPAGNGNIVRPGRLLELVVGRAGQPPEVAVARTTRWAPPCWASVPVSWSWG